MAAKKPLRVFDTDRRIKLGIWGLGRGMSFYRTCAALNIDVVAGCDYNEHMRENFLRANPGSFATADADEFLARDFDAVLLATFCPAHAHDAIKCLKAGKHVLSEVTAFHTMAEGVALVEAVEKSGKVYNLAENYPWSPANMWLARKWKEGLFGELMYAEYEYVHECRTLAYTYIDGKPVMPGNQVHSWRSWLNFHYYNTHSLGPPMIITGTRPVKVSAPMGTQVLAGYPMGDAKGMGGATPSLTVMSNGGLIRNFMGATTNDVHIGRLWGTLGSAQMVGHGLELRLGAAGHAPMMQVNPRWDQLGDLASKTGHGGGDFWVLYFFARQILTGEKAPWDIYPSCDVTIPGIQAYRSSVQDGQLLECPDFRDKKQRDKYRNDDWKQEHLDPRTWAFPASASFDITQHFSRVITDLIRVSTMYRAYADWTKVTEDIVDKSKLLPVIEAYVSGYDKLVDTYEKARRMIDAYPKANAARVLREMLEVGQEEIAKSPKTLAQAKKALAALKKTVRPPFDVVSRYECSPLQPKRGAIRDVKPPGKGVKFAKAEWNEQARYADIRKFSDGKDGVLYIRAKAKSPRGGKGRILFGADGPVKVWVNGKLAACEPTATNPIKVAQYAGDVSLRKGANDILFALDTNRAGAWGVTAAIALDE